MEAKTNYMEGSLRRMLNSYASSGISVSTATIAKDASEKTEVDVKKILENKLSAVMNADVRKDTVDTLMDIYRNGINSCKDEDSLNSFMQVVDNAIELYSDDITIFGLKWKKSSIEDKVYMLENLTDEQREEWVAKLSNKEKKEISMEVRRRKEDDTEYNATLIENLADVCSQQSMCVILVMGLVGPYVQRLLDEAQRCNIDKVYKFKAPKHLKDIKKNMKMCMNFAVEIESGAICQMITSDLPYYWRVYDNVGTFTIQAQELVYKKQKVLLDDMYAKCLSVANELGNKYPDLLACSFMTYLLAQCAEASVEIGNNRVIALMKEQHERMKKQAAKRGRTFHDFEPKDYLSCKKVTDLCLSTEKLIDLLINKSVSSELLACTDDCTKVIIELGENLDWCLDEMTVIIHDSIGEYIYWYFCKMIQNEIKGIPQPKEIKDDLFCLMDNKFIWCRIIGEVKSISKLIKCNADDVLDILDEFRELKNNGITTPAIDSCLKMVYDRRDGKLRDRDKKRFYESTKKLKYISVS